MEPYLSLDIHTKFIKQFSKFRCSAHNLLVERGRHIGTSYRQRVCPLCSLHEIEDEYHFAFICHLYSEIRLWYLPDKYKYCRPFFELFHDEIKKKKKKKKKRTHYVLCNELHSLCIFEKRGT